MRFLSPSSWQGTLWDPRAYSIGRQLSVCRTLDCSLGKDNFAASRKSKNWPALDVLIKGASAVPMWRELLLLLEDPLECEPAFLWVARVPSKSNIADGPSRGTLAELEGWRVNVEALTCPMTGQQLQSFFD